MLGFKNSPKKTDLETAIRRAVVAEKAHRAALAQDRKLSPEAWIAEALKLPNANAEEMEKAIEAIKSGEAMLQMTVWRLKKVIKEWFLSRPGTKINYNFDAEGDAALAYLGVHRQSMFAAVGAIIAREAPGLFGSATSLDGYDEAVAKAKAERDEAFAILEDSWTRHDVTVAASQTGGWIRLTVNCTGGSECIGPDLAARLVNYSMNLQEAA